MLCFLLWWQRYLAVFFHGYFLCIGHWLFFPTCKVHHRTPVCEKSPNFLKPVAWSSKESNWPILQAGLGYYITVSTQLMSIFVGTISPGVDVFPILFGFSPFKEVCRFDSVKVVLLKKYLLKRNDKLNAYIRSGMNEIAQFSERKVADWDAAKHDKTWVERSATY